MPIESLTAGPPVVAGPGATSATKASAPPGFTAALDQATKTWTAHAEGQTTHQPRGNDRPAANPTHAGADARADATAESTAAKAEPNAAKADDKAGKTADQADAAPEVIVADGVTPTLVVDPAVLAAAQAAAAAAVATEPSPGTGAAQTAAPVDPAQVALLATQVQAAASAVAAGQPVDPAAPGVAELLQSVASGQIDVADLPPEVQALVAKATAATAPAGASAPSTTPIPSASPALAPTAAAADAAAASAPDASTDATPAPSLSPLAAAIQAAANAQAGGDAQAGPGDQQSQAALAAAAALSPTPAAEGEPSSAMSTQAPIETPVAAPTHESSPFAAAPVVTATTSTVAAPATPTVSGATPGAQASAIEALVSLSRTRGHSSARIALAPEQLGGIQVTLVFGADGVTARMIAERPEAAAALQRAGQDLREALQQQGVDLARLETSFAGDQRQGQGERSAQGAGTGMSGGNGGGQSRRDLPADTAQTIHVSLDESQAPEPLLPGRLVDLRA